MTYSVTGSLAGTFSYTPTLSGNVLTNDTGFDRAALITSLASPPAPGTVSLLSDGVSVSNTATDTNTNTEVSDAPIALGDSVTTAGDTSVTGNVVANDTDVERTTLTATLGTAPAHGTVNLSPNGCFTYSPAANYNGTDSFTYTASDDALTGNTATVTVRPVNDTPPIALGDSVTTVEDTTVAGKVVANAADAEGTTLTAASVSNPRHGTVILNANGSFTYTLATNYDGTDSFLYAASDGIFISNTAVVTITVTPVNDVPVAVGDSVTTAEDTWPTTPTSTAPPQSTPRRAGSTSSTRPTTPSLWST